MKFHHTAEAKSRIAAAQIGVTRSPETRAKMSAAKMGHAVSQCTRRKMSDAAKKRRGERAAWFGKEHSDESRLKMKVAALRRMCEGRGTRKFRDTKPELAMKIWLDDRGVEFQQQVLMFGHIWDFAIASLKVLIEVDGCYWHGCPVHYPGTRTERRALDRSRSDVARANGWSVFRIWEHTLSKRNQGLQ